jgi:HK97 family phage portal protein
LNLFQKIAASIALKAASYSGAFSISDPDANQKLSSSLGGMQTYTGKNVNDNSAMQITTVWACIRLLAETMGALPSAIYRYEKNGNATKIDDHPLYEILVEQPNAEMNGLEYREARTSNLAMRGNSYSIIERRSNGDVMSLYPLPAASVEVKKDSSTNFQTMYGFKDRGKQEWLPADKIWHTKGFSFNGLDGLSPIRYAREAFALSLAGEEFNARLFGQGLMPSARISIPTWLKDDAQRKAANDKLMQMQTGLQNMNRPMLLEGGMTVESGLITPDDAQFLQLRQFTVVEICRLFGVKPHMVAALERATDNNIEKLSLEFVQYTMLPYTRREEVGARKLFKPADRFNCFYRYNFEGLLRADSAARASLYSIMLQNGVFSRNEVRALENRNKVPDDAMDQYTVQSNMAMIDQLAALVAGRNNSPAPAAEPVKSGDTNIYVSPPNVTLNQKAATLTVNVPDRESHFEVNMPEMKASDVHVTVEPTDTSGIINAINTPRKAVFDDNGNPIGTIATDKLGS